MRRFVYRPLRPDVLIPGDVPGWRRSLTPNDRARAAAVGELLADLVAPAISHEAPDAARTVASSRVAGDLAAMGVLTDQRGGITRAEALFDWLRSQGRMTPAAEELLWQLTFDTRADRTAGTVVDAVQVAAGIFVDHSPLLWGASTDKDGQNTVLRLLVDPAQRLRGADAEGIVRMRIDPVHDLDSSVGTSRDSPVDVLSDADRPVLRVRIDASDAAIRVGVAGALASWLAWQPRETGSAATPAPGQEELAAVRVLAELDTLMRLSRSRSRFSRAVRGRVWPRTFHQQLLARPLARARIRVRALLAADRLPAGVAHELRDALSGRAPATITNPLDALPPNAAGPALHLLRRATATIGPVLTTQLTGEMADRSVALTAASSFSTALGAPAQAWADVNAAAISRARDGAARSLLPTPSTQGSRTPFKRPPMPGPKSNFAKRTPAGLARSLASLTMLAGMTHSGIAGAEGLGLTVLANVTQAEIDHLLIHPNRVTHKRHSHEATRTPDHLRNVAVERLYHLTRELVRRQDRLGRTLDTLLRNQLRATRLSVADMAYQVEAEVRSLLRDVREIKRNPLREPRSTQTYDIVKRGVVADAPGRLLNGLWYGSQYAASQIPSFVLGETLNSAVNLVSGNFLSTAASGVSYGIGAGSLRPHEVFFRQAVTAWDARQRLRYVAAAITYLLDRYGDAVVEEEPDRQGLGELGEPAGAGRRNQPQRPVPLDETADPRRYPVVRFLRLFKLAEALAYGRANRDAGRPAEISKRLQFYYKHLPAAITNAATAALAGTVLFPLGGQVLGAAVGLGFASRAIIGLAENVTRTLAPRYELYDLRRKLLEMERAPLTVSEIVEEMPSLAAVAADASTRITPVNRLRPGLGARISRSLTTRAGHLAEMRRRVATRTAEIAHWSRPPALSRGPVPVGEVRLTRRDHSGVAMLHRLATHLDQARSSRYSARADLDLQLIASEAVVLLDRLGLRTEQDPRDLRWSAVTAHLRYRGYRLVGVTRAVLEAWREVHPATDTTTGGTTGVRNPLSRVLAEARAVDPLAEQLWDAINTGDTAQYRFDVRPDGRVKAFPLADHRFVLSVAAAQLPSGTRAELLLAPDDLWHAMRRTHRDEPHRLNVNPSDLAEPVRLARVLAWAAREVVGVRGRTAYRVKALLDEPTSPTFTLPSTPAVQLPAGQEPGGQPTADGDSKLAIEQRRRLFEDLDRMLSEAGPESWTRLDDWANGADLVLPEPAHVSEAIIHAAGLALTGVDATRPEGWRQVQRDLTPGARADWILWLYELEFRYPESRQPLFSVARRVARCPDGAVAGGTAQT